GPAAVRMGASRRGASAGRRAGRHPRRRMTRQLVESGGQLIEVVSALPWVSRLIEEAAQGELRVASPGAMPSGVVRIEGVRDAFDLRGFDVLTRGAWQREGGGIVQDGCTSGFDLHVAPPPAQAPFRVT